MTCKDKFYEEHGSRAFGHRDFCPRDCGYLQNPEYCKEDADEETVCEQCWDRELPEKKEATCDLNYKAEYTRLLEENKKLKDEIKGFKHEKMALEYKLNYAKGAIAMIETIYGRRWNREINADIKEESE